MKKLLIIVCIFPLAATAQIRVPHFPVDIITNRIAYTLTVDVPGAKKEKLYEL